jgi:chitinase
MKKLLFAVATSIATPMALAGPTEALGLDEPFDRYTWLTAHNAFTSNGLIRNQRTTIAEQLEAGVRAFMLDLHPFEGRVALCHAKCTYGPGTERFATLLEATILPYLDTHPEAVITLQLEDFSTLAQLKAELRRVPRLGSVTFDPTTWDTERWPTYRELISRGQRLLIFSLNEANSGAIFTAHGTVHIMPTVRYTVENYWSLGMTILTHDRSCRSRWDADVQPLDRTSIPGKPGWRPLFTMNHFHGLPVAHHASHDNAFEELRSRYLDYCLPAAKRKPNYVAVDFHDEGDAQAFVDWLNQLPDAR